MSDTFIELESGCCDGARALLAMRSGVQSLKDEWPQLSIFGGEKVATLTTSIVKSELFSGILDGELGDRLETAVSGKFSTLRDVLRAELLRLDPSADRVLIFVTTRRSAKLLRDLINGFLGEAGTALSGFKADYIVGHGSGGRGGDDTPSMSVTSQQQVVRDFKDGAFNILVSTAVCQEGIDVGSCSLVIRYDSASTETALIQTRGRARAKGSLLVVFIPPDADGNRERLDFLAREALMIDAVATVHRAEASLIPEQRRRGFLEADAVELLAKFCEQTDADGEPMYEIAHARSQSTFTAQKSWAAKVVMPAGCDVQPTTEGEPRKTKEQAQASAAYIVLVQLLNIGVLPRDYIGTAWLMLVRQGDENAQEKEGSAEATSSALCAGPNPVAVLNERLPSNLTFNEVERSGSSHEPQFTVQATRASDGAVLGTGRARSIKEARKVAAVEALRSLDSEMSEQAQAKAVFKVEQQRVATQGSAERKMPPATDDTDATAEEAEMLEQERVQAAMQDEQQRGATQSSAASKVPAPTGSADTITQELKMSAQPKRTASDPVAALYERLPSNPTFNATERSGPSHEPQFTVEATRPSDGVVLGVGRARSIKEAKKAAAAEALRFLDSEMSEQAQAKATVGDEQQRVATHDSAERKVPLPIDVDEVKMSAQHKQAKVMSKSAISVLNENGVLDSIDFRTEMSGPHHQPTFDVKAVMGGRLIGTGQATTKKEAKEIAAVAALEFLKL